jgi:hypothetical protein
VFAASHSGWLDLSDIRYEVTGPEGEKIFTADKRFADHLEKQGWVAVEYRGAPIASRSDHANRLAQSQVSQRSRVASAVARMIAYLQRRGRQDL